MSGHPARAGLNRAKRGHGLVVERDLAKVETRVRFSLTAQ